MNVFSTSRQATFSKILIVIVVLFLLLVVINVFHNEVKNFIYNGLRPVQKILWKLGKDTSVFLGSLVEPNAVTRTNEELAIKNQELLNEIISLQQIKSENQFLREAFNTGLEKEFKLVLADIIGIETYGDFILIDRGTDDGILENMPVINSQKVLFGKISKVYKNFSKVLLISNNNNVLDVKILKDDTSSPPIYGAVKGEGNFKAILDTIPLDYEINNGDTLITSSLEGTFPKGLLVGRIIKIQRNDLKPFQTAQIDLFFNLKRANELFVISNYKVKE